MQDQFLTPEDRALLDVPEDDFIARFVEWTRLITDAPPYGVQAAALTALSLAAGDVVSTAPVFSNKPIPMNLYILLVGPSTVMRKTTILGQVRDLMPKHRQTRKPYHSTLDDVSKEGFNKAMAEAGNREVPLLFQADEVAGVFETSRARDSYLRGLDKILMKAYDHSPVTIHRTTSTLEAPRGAFVNIFAASTPEPLAEALGSEDVESGLLPRFIIFDLTDAAKGTKVPLLQQKTGRDGAAKTADELAEHLYRIAKSRADGVPDFTDVESSSESYPKTVIPFTDEALARIDALDDDINDGIALLAPGPAAIKGRAFWHVVKLSGLYRLSRMTADESLDTISIELADVIRAMWFMDAALEDLFDLTSKLGTNELERLCIAVLDILKSANGSKVKQTTIAKRLGLTRYTARDVFDTIGPAGRGDASFGQVGLERYWELSRVTIQDGRYERFTKTLDKIGRISKAQTTALFDRNIDANERTLLWEKALSTGAFEVITEDTGKPGPKPQYLQKKGLGG